MCPSSGLPFPIARRGSSVHLPDGMGRAVDFRFRDRVGCIVLPFHSHDGRGWAFWCMKLICFSLWISLRCPFFSIARWGCSARFVNAMGRSVDLDLPSCVAKAGMRHARHAAWSTWPPCIVIYIDLPKNPKFEQRYHEQQVRLQAKVQQKCSTDLQLHLNNHWS